MTVRRLDINGDISTSGQQFIDEQAEVAQTISTRLRLFDGEYFRDVNEGTKHFSLILVKNANIAAKDSEIRRRISQTNNVSQITSFNADYSINSREYKVSTSVITPFGEIEISPSI